MRDRRLVWDGCVNVRDLGGHPTEDGGETRFAAVVRADSVRGLSDTGWEALVAYGVRTIVDLRWHDELAEDPPRELPVAAVHVPLFGERAQSEEADRMLRTIADPIEWRRRSYLEALARFRENVARAITAVAEARAGGVVVHCAGGVDRTGLVTALLLRVAGVAREHVAADYGASEANWAPHVGRWIDAAGDDVERERRRRLAIVRPEVMLGVLEELEASHGSVRQYLLDVGASPEHLDRVRARLLG